MIANETELSYFIELFSTGHFTKTAQKLRITQSALTQSISKLERKIGASLFYRTKKGCHPTPTGEILFHEACELRERWSALSEKVRQQKTALRGRFRLGCHPSLGIRLLPPFLKKLAAVAPEIEVDLSHDYSRNLTSKVISYELDFCFAVNPVRHPDLVLKKIDDDRIRVWKSKRVTVPVKKIFTDLSPLEVRAMFGKKFKAYSDWPIVQSTSLELILAFAGNGVGVGILPEKVATRAREFDLEPLDEALPSLHDEIFLVHRLDTMKSEAGKLLTRIAAG